MKHCTKKIRNTRIKKNKHLSHKKNYLFLTIKTKLLNNTNNINIIDIPVDFITVALATKLLLVLLVSFGNRLESIFELRVVNGPGYRVITFNYFNIY